MIKKKKPPGLSSSDNMLVVGASFQLSFGNNILQFVVAMN